MPVSEKQLIANRKNAQKSTGPKTERGKAISSKNALKHGHRSPDVIINSPHLKENVSEYNMLLNSLFDDLKPVGRFQELLVYKIANSLWRSQRVIMAETAQLHRQFKSVDREMKWAADAPVCPKKRGILCLYKINTASTQQTITEANISPLFHLSHFVLSLFPSTPYVFSISLKTARKSTDFCTNKPIF